MLQCLALPPPYPSFIDQVFLFCYVVGLTNFRRMVFGPFHEPIRSLSEAKALLLLSSPRSSPFDFRFWCVNKQPSLL